ncbi:MAG: TlpA family protein disulfide reductase [Bacteroidetes bacterium]|nr:TlpA family protein disulfide reductase [Bacteroidota bacterium]
MKKTFKFALAVLLFASFIQSDVRKVPASEVKTLDGKSINTEKLSNDGKPILISFWATWCSPCKKELNAIAEVYDDWKKETGVKIIAVSIDDSRSSGKIAPYVNGKGWDYEEYIDVNSDFKRGMGVNMPPHTFILNGKGEIVWQHVGFKDGDEALYIEVLRKVAKGEKIDQ